MGEQIVSFASSVGIERRRLADYLRDFDQYDVHDSGTLGVDAIDEVLRALALRPVGDGLQELYTRLEIRRDQQVPLMKFLELLHAASSMRGSSLRRISGNSVGEV